MFRGSKLMRRAFFHRVQPRYTYENPQALLQNPAIFPRCILNSTSLSPRLTVFKISSRSSINPPQFLSSPKSSRQSSKRRGKAYQSDLTKTRRRPPVPEAYRRPEEQEQSTKNYFKSDSGIHHSRKPKAKANSLKREIVALIRAQDQSKCLIQQYEKQLGMHLISSPNGVNDEHADVMDRNESFEKAIFENDVDLPTLVQTERAYSRLCVKLRQLIAGWSSIRTDYGCMDSDVISSLVDASRDISDKDQMMKNPLPAEIAYFHLVQLEMLRKQRAKFIEIAIDKSDHSRSEGVMGWLTKKVETLLKDVDGGNEGLQFSGSSSPLDLLKAHLSPDYTTDQQLYGDIMKSFVYWRDIPFPTRMPENSDNVSKDQLGTNDMRRRRRDRGKGSILHPTPTSAVILADRLDAITLTMNQNFQSGNPNCRPLRINYHFLLKYFSFTHSKHHAMRASELLRSMEEVTRDKNDYQNTSRDSLENSVTLTTCTPTLTTYNKVLKTYRNLAGNRSESKENRRWAALEAQKTLFELHAKEVNSLPNVSMSPHQAMDLETVGKDLNMIPFISGPSMPSYDLVLNSLYAAGHLIIPDMCDRVDSIMELMMGKEEYLGWIGEWRTQPTQSQLMRSALQPDMKMHHILILIFSTTRNPSKLARARVLLKAVEGHNKLLSKEGGCITGLQKNPNLPRLWPTYRAYNSFLAGLNSLASAELRRTLKKKQTAVNGSKYPTIESNAEFAMSLLDSMIQRHGSMPDIDTFHYIMRLWSVSGSKHAGERGEELLSRMEIHNACAFDERRDSMNPNHLSYEIALECWATSASAMEPGAAHRALMLLERMESQCREHYFKEGRETQNTVRHEDDEGIYNNNLSFKKESSFVHSAAIHACTVTRLNADKDDAFRIAFDVYNRMTEHDIIPTQLIYRDLLYCCFLLPASAQRRRLQLSRTVFEAACQNGCVDARVLAALKQVNSELLKAYEPLPEHSAALRELKRSFV